MFEIPKTCRFNVGLQYHRYTCYERWSWHLASEECYTGSSALSELVKLDDRYLPSSRSYYQFSAPATSIEKRTICQKVNERKPPWTGIRETRMQISFLYFDKILRIVQSHTNTYGVVVDPKKTHCSVSIYIYIYIHILTHTLVQSQSK